MLDYFSEKRGLDTFKPFFKITYITYHFSQIFLYLLIRNINNNVALINVDLSM